jgi:hypothetical protein
MIKDTLIEFETARFAKQLGFNYPVYYRYNEKGELIYMNVEVVITPDEDGCYAAPTQSHLHKWLRDSMDMYIQIKSHLKYKGFKDEDKRIFSGFVNLLKDPEINISVKESTTYEKAMEASLYKALEIKTLLK